MSLLLLSWMIRHRIKDDYQMTAVCIFVDTTYITTVLITQHPNTIWRYFILLHSSKLYYSFESYEVQVLSLVKCEKDELRFYVSITVEIQNRIIILSTRKEQSLYNLDYKSYSSSLKYCNFYNSPASLY